MRLGASVTKSCTTACVTKRNIGPFPSLIIAENRTLFIHETPSNIFIIIMHAFCIYFSFLHRKFEFETGVAAGYWTNGAVMSRRHENMASELTCFALYLYVTLCVRALAEKGGGLVNVIPYMCSRLSICTAAF